MGRLAVTHEYELGRQVVPTVARRMRDAAEAFRDLSFEMERVGWPKRPYPNPPESLIPYFDRVSRTWAVVVDEKGAFRPTGNNAVDDFLGSELTQQVLAMALGFKIDHLATDGVVGRFNLASADAATIRSFALALADRGVMLETYIRHYGEREAESLRTGTTGRMPELALHYLAGWADGKGIGPVPLARAIVERWHLLDPDATWFPPEVAAPQHRLEPAIERWAGAIKNAIYAYRRRQGASPRG